MNCLTIPTLKKRGNASNVDVCVVTCDANRCADSNKHCVIVSDNLLSLRKRKTDSTNDLCVEFCSASECFNSNIVCVGVSSDNKRNLNNEDHGHNDRCVTTCDANRCNGNDNTPDFICRVTASGFLRKVDGQNDTCVKNCITKETTDACWRGFKCIAPAEGDLQTRTLRGNECVNECGANECYRSNFNCEFANNEFKASTDRNHCYSQSYERCGYGRCHDSNFVCRNRSNTLLASSESGDLCVSSCTGSKCNIDNICIFPKIFNTNQSCLNFDALCPNGMCIQNNQCVSPTSTNLASNANGGRCLNSNRCPVGQCSVNNICQSPSSSFALSDNLGGVCTPVVNPCANNACFRNDFFAKRSAIFNFPAPNSQAANPVTIFKNYSFLIKFQSGSLSADSTPSCMIMNGDAPIGSISTEKDGLDSIYCIVTPTLLGVKLDKDLTIRLLGLKFTNNYVGYTTIALLTDRTNGILLSQLSTFYNYSVYDQYDKANSLIRVTDVRPTNVTGNELCTSTPCTTLYPWTEYTLQADVEIDQYLDDKEVNICFSLSVVNRPSLGSVKVTSQAFDTTETADILTRALSANSDEGLKLTATANGDYCLDNFSKYINPTEDNKILQFYSTSTVKRRFRLTFSGFNTGNNVSVPAFSSIDTLVYWKHSPSVLSKTSFSKTISIEKLTFSTATSVAANAAVNNSVTNNEDDSENVLYANNSYHLRFAVKIPKVNLAGIFRIAHTYVQTDSEVHVNFVTSTCDFLKEQQIFMELDQFASLKIKMVLVYVEVH